MRVSCDTATPPLFQLDFRACVFELLLILAASSFDTSALTSWSRLDEVLGFLQPIR